VVVFGCLGYLLNGVDGAAGHDCCFDQTHFDSLAKCE
jgi:hypothetical protein